MANFMQYLNINTVLTPASTNGAPSKQVLLIGQRITGGKLYFAQNGYPQPNLYQPIQLPAFPNGAAALSYLGNLGLQYQIGYNFTTTLLAPNNVTTSNGNTILNWTIIPPNFVQLAGLALSGTISQTTPSAVTASLLSAYISSGQAYIIVSGIPSPNFSTSGGVLTLNGVNNVIYPDPVASDPIALMCWDFYQAALSANVSSNGSPTAYISIISDRDTTISPNSTSFSLHQPDVVTVSGTTVTLQYNYNNNHE